MQILFGILIFSFFCYNFITLSFACTCPELFSGYFCAESEFLKGPCMTDTLYYCQFPKMEAKQYEQCFRGWCNQSDIVGVANCYYKETYTKASKALENKDLFQGDILGHNMRDEYYNAVPNDNLLWTNNVLYYTIDKSLADYEPLIKSSMNQIMNQTGNCILFIKRASEENYINIVNGSVCNSNVGMIRGKQDLNLGDGCYYIGIIMHELMHAIGFYHEHCRSDRDDYLEMHMENVISGYEFAFNKLNANQNRLLEPFDYESIMIYGDYSFSKNNNKTITAKNNVTLRDPVLKKGLTNLNVAAIRKLYRCNA